MVEIENVGTSGIAIGRNLGALIRDWPRAARGACPDRRPVVWRLNAKFP